MSLNKYKEIYQQKRDYSIGVEEEFMICDPKSGKLINKANEIMECVSNKDRYSYELLLSEIETNTPICKTVGKAIESLSEQRLELKKIGNDLGFRIGISGTHPTARPSDQKFVTLDPKTLNKVACTLSDHHLNIIPRLVISKCNIC